MKAASLCETGALAWAVPTSVTATSRSVIRAVWAVTTRACLVMIGPLSSIEKTKAGDPSPRPSPVMRLRLPRGGENFDAPVQLETGRGGVVARRAAGAVGAARDASLGAARG